MAQADSVPSSTRQLITGGRASQSTNLRAVNLPAALKLPAVRVKPVDRRYFIGGSDVPVIADNDEALFPWIWRERRGHVDLEGLSNRRWYAASTGQERLGPNIGALSFESAGFVLGRLLRNILITP
jgi:hypothetical protein